ncbi:MAG: hypothetical protein HUJ51_04390 [Eggerthellaceae bacterium]|nr:hypothetical protein [Eggerthellaceae bacterium]
MYCNEYIIGMAPILEVSSNSKNIPAKNLVTITSVFWVTTTIVVITDIAVVKFINAHCVDLKDSTLQEFC